jgi:hypothetical protein
MPRVDHLEFLHHQPRLRRSQVFAIVAAVVPLGMAVLVAVLA